MTFLFFSTTTPTPSYQRGIFFSTTMHGFDFDDESILFNDVGHYSVSICGGDLISIFPSTRTCPELYSDTFLFVESHLRQRRLSIPMSPCRICRLIKYVCHHVVLVFDVDRVELFRRRRDLLFQFRLKKIFYDASEFSVCSLCVVFTFYLKFMLIFT